MPLQKQMAEVLFPHGSIVWQYRLLIVVDVLPPWPRLVPPWTFVPEVWVVVGVSAWSPRRMSRLPPIWYHSRVRMAAWRRAL